MRREAPDWPADRLWLGWLLLLRRLLWRLLRRLLWRGLTGVGGTASEVVCHHDHANDQDQDHGRDPGPPDRCPAGALAALSPVAVTLVAVSLIVAVVGLVKVVVVVAAPLRILEVSVAAPVEIRAIKSIIRIVATALVVVRWLVAFVGQHGFAPFAWYRIALGAAMLAVLTLAAPT